MSFFLCSFDLLPHKWGPLRKYVRVLRYICNPAIFLLSPSSLRHMMKDSLRPCEYLHVPWPRPPWRMCSGKNVLLRLGSAKARAGGTAFFAEQHLPPFTLSEWFKAVFHRKVALCPQKISLKTCIYAIFVVPLQPQR